MHQPCQDRGLGCKVHVISTLKPVAAAIATGITDSTITQLPRSSYR